MTKYKVVVNRTVYASAAIEIWAADEKEAEKKAIGQAGDLEYSTIDADYGVLSVEKIQDEPETPQRYELFYSTGGHGGPYHTLHEAQEWALRLLKGSASEQYIAIAQYDSGAILRVPGSILPMGFREVDRKTKA